MMEAQSVECNLSAKSSPPSMALAHAVFSTESNSRMKTELMKNVQGVPDMSAANMFDTWLTKILLVQ